MSAETCYMTGCNLPPRRGFVLCEKHAEALVRVAHKVTEEKKYRLPVGSEIYRCPRGHDPDENINWRWFETTREVIYNESDFSIKTDCLWYVEINDPDFEILEIQVEDLEEVK